MINHTRRIATVLAAILAAQLTACGDAPTVETTATAPVTESETTFDSLPSDLDFGGAVIPMYVWENTPAAEYFVEEATGDIVDDAIYMRNLNVEQRLNVTFDFTTRPGTNAERDTFVAGISNSILAGDSAYEITAGYSMCLASLTSAQLLCDLAATKYLDFNQPWWSDDLLGQTSVYGKLYFASGDISTNMLHMMYAIFFNKSILDGFKLEDPYELVLNGKWTLDKMIEMSSGVYVDLNGNGQKDREDQLGTIVYPVYIDGFYFASGMNTTDINADGVPVISQDYASEKVHDLINKLCAFLFETPDSMIVPYSTSDDFSKGNVLFYPDELVEASTGLRDKTFGFGILPMPKYDEAQDSYYTLTSFPYSLYGIPLDAKDPDRASAVLEALASESYRTVTPALFETAMKVKYSEDERDAQIYDILKSTVVFDFGRVFNDSLSSKTYSMFRNAVINNDTNWASTWASNKDSLASMLADVVSKFNK